MGKLPKLLTADVNDAGTDNAEPSPDIAPAPGNIPAPATLITALSGPPQAMMSASDYHVATTSGYTGAPRQGITHTGGRPSIDID